MIPAIAELVSYLVGGTALVRAKHDHIGGGVGEFLSMKLLVLLEKLQVGTTADERVFGVNVSAV